MDLRPNIIIINPDQMRADSLHHLGNEAAYTPNMDKMTQDGVSFSQAFCQNPVCTPSRCSFLTGLYPHVNGHRTMSNLLKQHESNLFREAKESGYYVWMNARGDSIAGQDDHLHEISVDEVCYDMGDDMGTDEGRGEKESDRYFSFYRGIVTPKSGTIANNGDFAYTKSLCKRIINRPSDRPLFAFLGLFDPHPPYRVEREFLDKIDAEKIKPRIRNIDPEDNKPKMEQGLMKGLRVFGWDEERIRQLRAVYLAQCARVDHLVGMIIDTLKDEGIYDNTAIFILSDHGDYTGDYGIVEKAQNCFPDCLTNVPLLIKPPAGVDIEPGINDNLVELVDFYATVLDLGEITADHDHFGRSLIPTMQDHTRKVREFVTCEGGRRLAEPQAMEQNNAGSFAGDEYSVRKSLQAREDGTHTKATMIRDEKYKYIRRLYEKDEFYDLAIGESVNRIDDPAYHDEIVKKQMQMLTWYQETCDIVPQKEDQRMQNEFYLRRIAMRDPERADLIREKMQHSGKNFFETMAEMNKQS